MKSLFFLVVLLSSSSTFALEPFQDSFRYGTYGLVAGALAGGASMALSEDPGSRLTPIARGASLGLYAGLMIALIKNLGDADESRYEVRPISVGPLSSPDWGLAVSRQF